ncbi:MAG: hypothetical protein KC419_08690, partial [Anaerolineales bacterium]|nr:hypothetical protein [Anaerolineales bacterium]
QTGQIMNNLMAITHGLNVVGEDVPLVAQLLGHENGRSYPTTPINLSTLTKFKPYLQKVMADVNPRMFSSLKIKDVIERLGSVIGGDETIADALAQLKQDASFRVVGDLPIGPVMEMLGMNVNDTPTTGIEEIAIASDGQ